MAAALLIHLEAVRKFAVSMGAHPGKEDVLDSQFAHIREILQTTMLTLEEAEKVVVALRAIPWPTAKVDVLMSCVSERVSKAVPFGKSKLQDYTALGSYFSESHWQQLLQEGPTEPKVELIIVHAANLGLKFPTEKTVQHITALALYVGEGYAKSRNMLPAMKFEFLQHIKRLMKKISGEAIPLFVLPAEPVLMQQEFPKVFDLAFTDGPPVKCAINEVQLCALAMTIPMRCSSGKLASTPSQQRDQTRHMDSHGGSSQNPQQMMFAMMEKFLEMVQPRTGDRQGQGLGLKFLQPTRPMALDDLPKLGLARRASASDLESEPGAGTPSRESPREKPLGRLPLPSPEASDEEADTEAAKPGAVKRTPTLMAIASRDSKKKSVDSATLDILQAIASRDSMKNASKAGTAKATRGQGSGQHAVLEALATRGRQTKAEQEEAHKPTLKRKAAPKAKLPTPGEARPRPCFTIEWTRGQVMCRTGLKGPGNYKAIKFGEGGSDAAIKAAKKWVAEQKSSTRR